MIRGIYISSKILFQDFGQDFIWLIEWYEWQIWDRNIKTINHNIEIEESFRVAKLNSHT